MLTYNAVVNNLLYFFYYKTKFKLIWYLTASQVGSKLSLLYSLSIT